MKQKQRKITRFPFNGLNGDKLIEYGNNLNYINLNDGGYKIYLNQTEVDPNLDGILSCIMLFATRYNELESYDKNCSAFIDDIIYALDFGISPFILDERRPHPIDLGKFLGIKKENIPNYPYLEGVIKLFLYSKGYETYELDSYDIYKMKGNNDSIPYLVYQSIELLEESQKKSKKLVKKRI